MIASCVVVTSMMGLVSLTTASIVGSDDHGSRAGAHAFVCSLADLKSPLLWTCSINSSLGSAMSRVTLISVTFSARDYALAEVELQYVAGMALEDQAQIIARATGGRGPNDEYLYNTASHLAELDLADADLDWLVSRVRGLKPA